MPPKGKKSKKSKKGVKASKKIQLTPKEEILSYQIQIREEYLTNLKFESNKIQNDFENVKAKLRIKNEERDNFANAMIEKYRMNLKTYPNKVVYDRSDVVNCMKANWEIKKGEENNLKLFTDILKEREDEVKELKRKRTDLEQLKIEIIQDNEHQIKVLKQIINDMKGNFDSISSYLRKNYNEKKDEIFKKQTISTNTYQQQACKKASKIINDDAKKEFADNKWLLTKINIHKETFKKLNSEIEIIEEENIELNKKIYELKQSNNGFQSLYLTELEPDQILFQEGLLGYDFGSVFEYSPEKSFYPSKKKAMMNYPPTVNDLPEVWKDYLNLYPINFDFLCVSGSSINIREPEPKSFEELEDEKYTIKTLSTNTHSFNLNE